MQKPFSFGGKTCNVGSAKCTATGLHLAVSCTDSFPHTAHLKNTFPSSLISPSCKMLLELILLNMNLNAMLPIFKPPHRPVHPACALTPRRGAAGREPRRGLGLLQELRRSGCLPAQRLRTRARPSRRPLPHCLTRSQAPLSFTSQQPRPQAAAEAACLPHIHPFRDGQHRRKIPPAAP